MAEAPHGHGEPNSGILLIAVGILMISDYFTIMAAKLQSLTPEAIRSRI